MSCIFGRSDKWAVNGSTESGAEEVIGPSSRGAKVARVARDARGARGAGAGAPAFPSNNL